jgi:hypothetical protein
MRPLPPDLIALRLPFAPLFSRPVFQHAQLLLAGAILAPGKRTVTAARRALGRAADPHFQNDPRVLNRARWSGRRAAGLRLQLRVSAFVPTGPVLVGLDETLERRQGAQIAARGIYRAAARSRKEYLNKAGGLRCMSLMRWVSLPWAGRVGALPFFPVLAPSERYHQERGQRPKTLAVWARPMIRSWRRWLPGRPLVRVADSHYAVRELLAFAPSLAAPVTIGTRRRLDAAR